MKYMASTPADSILIPPAVVFPPQLSYSLLLSSARRRRSVKAGGRYGKIQTDAGGCTQRDVQAERMSSRMAFVRGSSHQVGPSASSDRACNNQRLKGWSIGIDEDFRKAIPHSSGSAARVKELRESWPQLSRGSTSWTRSYGTPRVHDWLFFRKGCLLCCRMLAIYQ